MSRNKRAVRLEHSPCSSAISLPFLDYMTTTGTADTTGTTDAANTTATAVSNISLLNVPTQQYVRLLHEKQQLLNQVRDLQTQLNTLKEPLIEELSRTVQSVQICPSKEEENVYGGLGALVLKVKHDYETVTRDALVRLLTEFYEYLLPDTEPGEIQRLGQGTACWVWNNRKRVPVRYLDRTFALKPPPKTQKRKSEEPGGAAVASGGAKSSKVPRARFQPLSNMPHTRDDFLTVPSLAQVLSFSHPERMPRGDEDPVVEEDGEKEREDDELLKPDHE